MAETQKMQILIVAKQSSSGLAAAAELEKNMAGFAQVHFDPSTAPRLGRNGTNVKDFAGDLIITLGGDGTFLWTAHQALVPILPVRIEGHGFLCTTEYHELLANMEKIKNQNYTIESRMRLKCTAEGKNYPLSVNEVAFTRQRPSKVLEMSFVIDDASFAFAGDGLLLSTPSGSSAYAASAGASLLDPSLEAIIITPLHPFHSSIKPLVVPAGKRVLVETKDGCHVIIDGHSGDALASAASFVVEKGGPLRVADLGSYSFYRKYANLLPNRKV